MKFLYAIQAYTEMKHNGEVLDVAFVKVYAENGNEALEKAKKVVEKPYYRIQEVIEIEEGKEVEK